MKKLWLVALVVSIINLNLFAQTKDPILTTPVRPRPYTSTGSVLIGGNFYTNFSTQYQQIGTNTPVTGDKFNNYNFNGYAGGFVAPFLAFGGVLYVNYQEQRQSNNLFTKTSYGLGGFARPYFYITPQFPFIIHGEFTVGIGSSTGNANTTDFRIAVGPGLAYFFTRNVSLEFLCLYRYTSSVYPLGTNSQVNNYTTNLTPTLGFQIYFHSR
jgi:hypothetical protein